MLYCKDLSSLVILSLYEGEMLGVVDKLFFDKKLKKLNEIEVIAENGLKLILPTKNIYRVGKHAITVKNNQAVEMRNANEELCVAPIFSKAYNINGEFLGVVHEIGFNDKFVTQGITLENGNLLPIEDVATCGKNTIIFNEQSKKTNAKNFVPKILKSRKTTKSDSFEKVVGVTNNKKAVVQDMSFLIGRICTKNIYNFNNEILIKAQGVVNKKNLKEINKFGKLKELMLYLK